MATVMKASEFVDKLVDVAKNYKTLYVMGCFGAPMSDANKKRYTKNHTYNTQAKRTAMINSATSDTFGFDCVNLLKGVLWGWNGDKSKTYGGAKYATKGVPDTNADGMIKLCRDVTTDFSKIEVGEAVWCTGHIGVYIGNGLAVESTPAWKNCVQITAVKNIGTKSGYVARNWTKHGKLPYVEYDVKSDSAVKIEPETTKPKPKKMCTVEIEMLEKCAENSTVKALQTLLIGYGYSCGKYGADGDFGSDTLKAVKAYQDAKDLEADGVVGPATWSKLLGVK